MSTLRAQFDLMQETVQNLELAATQRYFEGLELMLDEQWDGGIYLMGYAAEITLKVACYRFDGAGPGDVRAAGPYKPFGDQHFRNVDRESFHSLRFWVRVLCHRRRIAGQPFHAAFERQLVRTGWRLHRLWWNQMRYRPAIATEDDALAVYNDVTWLRDHALRLWT